MGYEIYFFRFFEFFEGKKQLNLYLNDQIYIQTVQSGVNSALPSTGSSDER
jgi:hypothetical protein